MQMNLSKIGFRYKVGFIAFLFVALICSVLMPINIIGIDNLNFSLRTLLPFIGIPFILRILFRHYSPLVLSASLMFIISFIHSNSISSSARTPIFFIYFCALCAIFESFVKYYKNWDSVIRFFTLILLLQPISVIAFLIFPQLESNYLSSSFSQFIIGFDISGNVFDLYKSGGLLFENGNRAQAFGFAFFCLVQVIFQKRFRLFLSLILIVSIFFTGSKTPIFLAPLTFFVGIGLVLSRRLRRSTRIIMIFACVGLLIISGFLFGNFIIIKMAEIQTFSYRLLFWWIALRNIQDYWLFGGGPNYWVELFTKAGKVLWFQPGIPVHNFTLSMLMISGIVPLLLVMFYLVKLWWQLAKDMLSPYISVRSTAFWTGLATFWVFIYSQVENTTAFGDSTSMILVALLIGIYTNKRHSQYLVTHEGTDKKSMTGSYRPSFRLFLPWMPIR
jgi:hypothetical protein